MGKSGVGRKAYLVAGLIAGLGCAGVLALVALTSLQGVALFVLVLLAFLLGYVSIVWLFAAIVNRQNKGSRQSSLLEALVGLLFLTWP